MLIGTSLVPFPYRIVAVAGMSICSVNPPMLKYKPFGRYVAPRAASVNVHRKMPWVNHPKSSMPVLS